MCLFQAKYAVITKLTQNLQFQPNKSVNSLIYYNYHYNYNYVITVIKGRYSKIFYYKKCITNITNI